MGRPRIDWNFNHMPALSDSIEPLGTFTIDGHEMLIAINHTREELFFVWDDSYGKLVKEGEA